MTFLALTSNQCDAESPLDETLFQTIRTNFDDHQSRISSLEDPSSFYKTHFDRDHRYASGQALISAGAATLQNYDGDLTLKVDGAIITEQIAIVSATDEHWLHIQRNSTDNGAASVELNRVIYPDNRVYPITFICRIRIEANSDVGSGAGALFIGLHDASIKSSNTRPTNGVYLERVDGSNWRFVASNGGANTVGSSFSPPTSDTWFEVKIIWVSDAQVDCYTGTAGGVFTLRETLTTNLPLQKTLYANINIVTTNSTTNAFRIDRMSLQTGGPVVDMA